MVETVKDRPRAEVGTVGLGVVDEEDESLRLRVSPLESRSEWTQGDGERTNYRRSETGSWSGNSDRDLWWVKYPNHSLLL